jgi:pimeloyl-ACP methyl ester carboxylesterase
VDFAISRWRDSNRDRLLCSFHDDDGESAMPVLRRDDAEIYFEEYGSGYPVLLFAPGGLRSRLEMWHSPATGPARVWNDWTEALAGRFRVIAMDQRNAGHPRGPLRPDHGWHTYAADHLALMDRLGHTRFHTLGGCIGSSFCLKLCEIAPQRISAAVLQNPIGLNPEFPTYYQDGTKEWGAAHRAIRPTEFDDATLDAFSHNMWDSGFVFSVSRDFARRCPVPSLLLPGNDKPHPAVISAELAGLLPGVELLRDWRGPEHLTAQRQHVLGFLEQHTPA